MSEKKNSFSLEQLDSTKASAKGFEFGYKDPGTGGSTGVFFTVLGSESEVVTKEVARLINERRRKEAARLAKSGKNDAPEFDTLESDVEFGQRLAAVRLVGWRGITEPWSVENALRLCKSNRDIATQINLESDKLGNFIKL